MGICPKKENKMLKANKYHPLPKIPATPKREIDRVAIDKAIKAINDQWVAKHLARKQ